MSFINRESELDHLDSIWRRPGAQFLVLYGRRRIGKTALLSHWLTERRRDRGLYWVAYRSSPKILLDRFSEAVQPWLKNIASGVAFKNWESAFRQLGQLANRQRLIVIIDEFPYLLDAVQGVASILQAVWDRELKDSNLMLVLAGSHFGMMHKTFLSSRSPLFGRATADCHLQGIAPNSVRLFLKRYSEEQVVETYSVVGGVPRYLELWDDSRPVLANIRDLILSPLSLFKEEANFLIQDEIPEPRIYLGVLEAIGAGMKGPSMIAQEAGLLMPHVGKYLHVLRSLRLIRREVSIDASDPEISRLSRYEIADSYLRFFFSMVRPNNMLLEQGRIDRLLDIIRSRFDAYVGHTGYEEMCRQTITKMGDAGELPFQPELIGRIWNRRVEIDIAALSHKEHSLMLGECKWSRRPVGVEEMERLQDKANGFSRIKGLKIHLAFFSRNGYSRQAMAWAKREGIILFSMLKRTF